MDALPPSQHVFQQQGKHPKQKRMRLSKEQGYILEDFFNHVSQNPGQSQKLELLDRIRKFPGYELYRETNLHFWFYRRRQQQRSKVTEISSTVSPITPCSLEAGAGVYSSLNKKSIEYLTTLSKPVHDPSPDVIEAWATLLNATAEDVTAWLHAKRHETVCHSHLPTPAESTSPEPVSPIDDCSSPATKLESPQSPIITHSQELNNHFLSSSGPMLFETTHGQSSTAFSPRMMLAHALASAYNEPSAVVPATASEFSTLFASAKLHIDYVIEHANNGTFWKSAEFK